ncbi:MAG: four helix bundle protein [Bacteroidota bacterium]
MWQKAHQFVLRAYEFTKKFPKEETYCLTSQFRRAAISVAANIAEGFKKKGIADKLRFYNISQGSLSECQYYCILAKDLNYGDTQELINISFEIEKLLESYSRTIQNSQ